MVTVRLDEEIYGLPIECIDGIVTWEPLTRVPGMPTFVAGILAVRGSTRPVIDLRVRLGLPPLPGTPSLRIVLVQHNSAPVGFIVDSVQEVVWIQEESIEKTPQLLASSQESFLEGIANLPSGMVILLNIAGLFSDKERSRLQKWTDYPDAVEGRRESAA